METVGLGLYFEDLPVVRIPDHRTHHQDADICAFINCIHMTELLFTDMGSSDRSDSGPLPPARSATATPKTARRRRCRRPATPSSTWVNIENPAAGDTIHVE
jgi:hypothetical protein